MAKVTQVRKGGSRECCVSCFMSCRVVSLFSYTRLLAGQTRPIFNSVIVKEVCACESPEVRSEEARAMKKSRGQRGTTYGDGAYLEIEREEERMG